MKILMIGLGSIGQRHLRNIRRLYGSSVEILAYRVRRLKTTFSDTMQIRENVDLEQEYNLKVFTDLHQALNEKPDAAFICNVTSAHIPCALEAAKAGCHLFLEKPVSNSMEGIDELAKIAKEKNLKVFVGFQNRYNPALRAAKKYISEGLIGSIISVHSEVGERLTTMHTYEDYKTTYMARSDLGGGVILNQMIHEIDYLRFIFGDLELINAAGSTGEKGLGIDVDDCCNAILKAGDIPVSLHGDFYQYPPNRFVKIIGSKGKIISDIIANTVTLCTGNDVTTTDFKDFTRNDMFVDELKAFINCVETGCEPEITLDDGIASLKIALSAKSAATK